VAANGKDPHAIDVHRGMDSLFERDVDVEELASGCTENQLT
jgi:hypothetical protein